MNEIKNCNNACACCNHEVIENDQISNSFDESQEASKHFINPQF
jgi:hypothetical protein